MSTIEAKKQVVSEITEKFNTSQSSVLVDYRGLNVAEITALRKELRDNNVEYKVYKNTLARRAVADADLSELQETLTGPTAIAFGKDDVVAPAKILHNFSKEHDALEIKGGVIEGKVATLDEIKELSTLPDYNGLVSMLLSVLQAPIRNLAYATKAIADQKEESAE
ncbi:50S ribosomal protein L10 [Pseudogracilibacillus sp. SO30301A]|uniref:50S ribosomal protein L10 n=1 Tax=Pseudogracilibacillus sp. SO30301A TaxID=3098291 RepID=UPI00300DF18F